jgi:hypothetical protein
LKPSQTHDGVFDCGWRSCIDYTTKFQFLTPQTSGQRSRQQGLYNVPYKCMPIMCGENVSFILVVTLIGYLWAWKNKKIKIKYQHIYQIETYEIIFLALWSPQHQIYVQKTYDITYNF